MHVFTLFRAASSKHVRAQDSGFADARHQLFAHFSGELSGSDPPRCREAWPTIPAPAWWLLMSKGHHERKSDQVPKPPFVRNIDPDVSLPTQGHAFIIHPLVRFPSQKPLFLHHFSSCPTWSQFLPPLCSTGQLTPLVEHPLHSCLYYDQGQVLGHTCVFTSRST